MMIHRSVPFLLLVILAVGHIPQAAWAATEPAATVERLRGAVTATAADGTVRTLEKGDPVYARDVIATGTRRGSFVLLRFQDQSKFSLGRNSSMRVTEFRYKEDPEKDVVSTNVLRGAFRFVSGLVAKRRPQSMSVNVVVATIGIRGTTVGGEVVGESAKVVLLDPEQADVLAAIDVYNEFGTVTIDEAGFGTEIPDANSPPSPPRRMRLRTIENLMRSLQSIGRVSTPRPRPMHH